MRSSKLVSKPQINTVPSSAAAMRKHTLEGEQTGATMLISNVFVFQQAVRFGKSRRRGGNRHTSRKRSITFKDLANTLACMHEHRTAANFLLVVEVRSKDSTSRSQIIAPCRIIIPRRIGQKVYGLHEHLCGTSSDWSEGLIIVLCAA